MVQVITGGAVVSSVLARYGSRTIFALGGASHTYLLDAATTHGFAIVSGRHESATVAAADGYARISGRLGIALIIADQGVANAITGIATAFHAASPVVVLVARLPASLTESQAESDHDKQALVESVCKWSRTVPSADRLAEYVDTAARQALAGRPGPAVLVISQEYLSHRFAELPRLPPPPTSAGPAMSADLARAAANMLNEARRPLIICGSGATKGNAGAALRALAKEQGIPVVGNGLGRGLVPEDGELGFSWPLAQIAACEADVVMLAGARLKQRLGFGLPPRFSSAARWIQIDIEPREFHRNRRVDLPIHADAGEAVGSIGRAAREAGHAHSQRHRWLGEALSARYHRLDELRADRGEQIHPLELADEIAARLPEDAIYVGDGADIQNWMYASVRVRQAPGFLDHYPLGSMGIGTPLAVGAAAAARELAGADRRPRPVVLVTGDGSFGFYPSELNGLRLAGLPLVTVVGNDAAWGTEKHGQQRALGRTVNTELGLCAYEHIALAFDCMGIRVERREDLGQALDQAFAADRPVVVNVIIDPQAGEKLKGDPLASMIMFNDLASSLREQETADRD